MRRTKHVEELIEDDEQKPDFDDMMNEVQEEIEEHDAEDAVVSRAPELRQLSENIDKATNTWINATLQLESAIRKYNSAQTALGNAVDTISGKVDTINTHIDNVLKDAPTKLKVSVRVDDVDWKKIQDMFDKQHEWMTTQMQKHILLLRGLAKTDGWTYRKLRACRGQETAQAPVGCHIQGIHALYY